ncbi:MAG: hypothetical protein J6R20_02195 [Clostridia bacterium]|nr:hypothetical protein [Clostridia bacterium]
MSAISSMPANIVAWLKEREELGYIKFLTEFPAIKKEVPLRNTTVAVGIDGMTIVDSFVENDEGVLVENENCRQVNIKLRFSIHAPFSSGGAACHDAFTDIIDCLTFDSSLNIDSSGCDNIVSDRDTDAFVLTAWATVIASLCPAASSSVDLPSFLGKELLCGSHIRNEEIHLSPDQITYLGNPYRSGAYTGRGGASYNVDVGFKPRAVIVTALNGPPISIDFATQTGYIYSGVACEDGNSYGVELTDTGFKVLSNTTTASRGFYPSLNELLVPYRYIAFR